MPTSGIIINNIYIAPYTDIRTIVIIILITSVTTIINTVAIDLDPDLTELPSEARANACI